jgi:hypothetical protein
VERVPATELVRKPKSDVTSAGTIDWKGSPCFTTLSAMIAGSR